MNPIGNTTRIGTLGELLVQIRLFQYGIESAPPLTDSGNDLIAVEGEVFKAIQVKTSEIMAPPDIPPDHKRYHILACVHLLEEDTELRLDKSDVYLIPKEDIDNGTYNPRNLGNYIISEAHVRSLFEDDSS